MKKKRVPSERQIIASRANGTKSRGAVTRADSASGNATSSPDSRCQGLMARTVVLDSESGPRFTTLLAQLHGEFEPTTHAEESLVETMAIARWRLMRLWTLEKSALENQLRRQEASSAGSFASFGDVIPGIPSDTGDPAPRADEDDAPTRVALAFSALCGNSNTMESMSRYEVRFDRQYARAIRLLAELRRERKASGESQKQEVAEPILTTL